MRSKIITGFLVNAAAATIEPVTLPFATGQLIVQMRELIVCNSFDRVHLPDENTAWVDDEGLLHDPQHFVAIAGGYPDPLAGNVLFLGPSDRAGNTLSCTASQEFLASRVFCTSVGKSRWRPVTPLSKVTLQ